MADTKPEDEEEDDDVEHDAASPEGGAVAAQKKKKTPSKDLKVEAPITSGTADVLHNHPLTRQGTSHILKPKGTFGEGLQGTLPVRP